jgi:PD-(D/E)XK nuclease superfamily
MNLPRVIYPEASMNIGDSNNLTRQIIGLAVRVHTHLGPGLLESAYERCLCHEFDRTRSPTSGRSIYR